MSHEFCKALLASTRNEVPYEVRVFANPVGFDQWEVRVFWKPEGQKETELFHMYCDHADCAYSAKAEALAKYVDQRGYRVVRGDIVRSYDFEGREDCYVEGKVMSTLQMEGCKRYKIQTIRRVMEDKEVEEFEEFYFPPVNGTDSLTSRTGYTHAVVPVKYLLDDEKEQIKEAAEAAKPEADWKIKTHEDPEFDEKTQKLWDALMAVADPKDWKNPIKATIPRKELDITLEAIAHFCYGCGTYQDTDKRSEVVVQAPGYYQMEADLERAMG